MPLDYPDAMQQVRQHLTRWAVQRGDRRLVTQIRRARSMRELQALAGEEWDRLVAEVLET